MNQWNRSTFHKDCIKVSLLKHHMVSVQIQEFKSVPIYSENSLNICDIHNWSIRVNCKECEKGYDRTSFWQYKMVISVTIMK
jgi:hypothetical protein